ncbi:MAG: glutamate synthase subunit beta [Clostridiales bacterium]|nr:glutamate synthase subunit beta [Clostridiales bacterium]
MGKPTGFMEINRQVSYELPPEERTKNFNEFHIPLHSDEQQAQGARCMDCGVPFCQSGMLIGGMFSGCPLNNLIPEWNDLVYRGQWDLAVKRLIATNRYPEFTSRVCPALCEAACTCGMTTGNPVTVKENERAVVEYGYESGTIHAVPPPSRTGKRVAVVGTGPSGLSVADLLNKRGHKVTMYERSDRVGGLLMYGIPNMKLEKWVIDRRVDILKEEGIDFITSTDVGRDISAEELKQQYDAVVLCCGAKQPRDIGAPGRDAEGIHFAVDYLSSVTKSLLDSGFADGKAITAAGKKVLVIGGGDTGNDCVGTSIRQGCTSVTQLEMMPCPPTCRAPGNDWPEWPRVLKTDYGQQEAIAKFGSDPRLYKTTVKEFYKNESGHVCGALIAKLESQVVDGRRMMVPTGEEFAVECDLVLIAAGFTGCESYVAEAFGVDMTPRGTVADTKYATSQPGIFSCGDMRRGQSLVVWALREGRDTAAVVDEYLMGYTNL